MPCGSLEVSQRVESTMTTFVYDYPPTRTPRFYIDGEYVYPMEGGEATYWIGGSYWYLNPPSPPAAFWVNGNYIYECADGTPKYYLF